MEEIWASIENTGYLVSNLGNVKNKRGRVMKPHTVNYNTIGIRLGNNTKKSFRIPRLVATYFVPNPNNYTVVNHINGDSLDDRAINLEWCTQKHNLYHSRNITRNGTVISSKKIKKLYSENQSLSTKDFVDMLLLKCA